jgi:uncharacterized protein involved in tolerance to divalent cations
MKAVFLYVPFPNSASAKKTIRALLDKRLIACGNILTACR